MNQPNNQYPTQMNEIPNEVQSGPSNKPRRRRESLLDAASALASLGASSPRPSEQGGSPRPLVETVERNQDSPFTKRVIEPPTSLKDERKRGPPAIPMPENSRVDIPMTFPEKLMEVLEIEEISDIITWLPHGQGFVILQKRRFASEILPLYFKQSKFTSFTRKLNRWGFIRVTDGPETGAYYHDLFKRGNHMLCMQMHCQSAPSAEKGGAKSSSKLPVSRSPRSSPPLRVSDDGNNNPSNIEGYRNQKMVAFDLVLNRQRELLKESRDAERRREATASFMIGDRSLPFSNVFDMQHRLLRTNNNGRNSKDIPQPHELVHQDIMRQDQPRMMEQELARHGQQVLRNSHPDVCHSRRTQDVYHQPPLNGLDLARQQHLMGYCPRPRELLLEQSSREDMDLLLRHGPSSSTRRHHRLIMDSAWSALKSSEVTMGSQDYSTVTTSSSAPRLQTPLHSAMHAQLRQLEMHNRSVGDALKKEQPHYTFSQNDVARLHSQIGGERQTIFPAGAFRPQPNSSSTSSSGCSSSVRRASAA